MNESDMKNLSFETQVIHAGHSFDPATNSLASPLYQTATFGFGTVEDMDSAWDKLGYLYTREGNPTLIELEEKLKAMEGGESALTASSGLGIITSTLYAILEKGDHLLCSKGLFFHSNILMNDFLAKMCIDVSFADFKDLNDVQQKIQSNTKAFFIETPTNPKLGVVDIQAVAEIAKSNDCIFIVDSTFAPPPIQRPLSLGADLVVHSLTKYINGHGDALGGGVIGRKDLVDKIKYPSMPCFTGACLSPFNAWLIMRGMATLDMRVRKHCENALEIAKFLQTSPYVEKVIYPALPGYEGYELCQKQMNGMGGGIICCFYLMRASLSYISPYLESGFLMTATLVGTVSIIRQTGTKIFAGPVFGALSDKRGSTIFMMIVGFVIAIICVVGMMVTPVEQSNTMLVVVLMLVLAFVLFGMTGIGFAQISESKIPLRYTGAAAGLISVIGYVPDTFYYDIAGSWIENYGIAGYQRIFMLSAVVGVAGIILSIVLSRLIKKLKAESENA